MIVDKDKAKHPRDLQITGLENDFNLNDPNESAIHDIIKQKMYTYTVELQDDREDLDRKILKKQESNLY